MRAFVAATCLCGLTAPALAGAQTTHITFDSGWEGFNGYGQSSIQPTGGNPGAHVQTIHNNFGIEWFTQTNPAFTGDFSAYQSITVSIDVKVDLISFFGTPVTRNLILDLRSFSLGQNGYPWSSVWYNLGSLQTGQDWTTYTVTFDPNALVMPSGWGGTGAEDPNTFEPVLPANLTFADVLADVEEFSFTTYEPGYFYGFTDFDVNIDNIRIDVVPVPAPGALALLACAAGIGPRRRRN